jgi:glycine hydroxymethyltransferase
LVHVIAAKAVCFKLALEPEFVEYSRQVLNNAQALAASLAEAGCRIVSGGTDTHLMLVDVFAKGARGKDAETALDRAYITANKNAIPFDVNPPLNPSGMRFGSPAVTTRGFREAEMREVGELIVRALENISSETVLTEVRSNVSQLAAKFPLYAWRRAAAEDRLLSSVRV